LKADERRALAAAALVVVTGRSTAAALASYGVQADRIAVVEPGTDRAPLARGSRRAPMQLLCVATPNPGKGHAILFRALATVPHRNWRLTCVGSLERHPPTVARLRARLCEDGLTDQVALIGECDAAGLLESEASEEYTREIRWQHRSQLEARLRDIIEAQDRLLDGDYGTCAECADQIGNNRLMADPAVRLCIACQRSVEERQALEELFGRDVIQ